MGDIYEILVWNVRGEGGGGRQQFAFYHSEGQKTNGPTSAPRREPPAWGTPGPPAVRRGRPRVKAVPQGGNPPSATKHELFLLLSARAAQARPPRTVGGDPLPHGAAVPARFPPLSPARRSPAAP